MADTPIAARHLSLATVLVLTLVRDVLPGSVCPRDVVTAVFMCLAPLRGHDASQLVTAGEDVVAVRARCRDGSFRSAVRCVEMLQRMCRGSHQLPWVRDLTDTARMERAFHVFCDHVHLYAENRECLVREDTTIQNCVLMRANSFYHRPTDPDNRALEMTRICSFLEEMTRCIEQPVRHYCDSGLADVLIQFMSGITPPVCRPYNSAQGQLPRVWGTYIFLMLTHALLKWLERT